MKKQMILACGLVMVMGLFFANQTYSQNPPWGAKSGSWWPLTGSEWISVDGRIRALDRIVTPNVGPGAISDRFDLGMGSHLGGNLEMYKSSHATRPGHLNFVYGGGDFGQILFAHYNGSTWTDKMILDKNGDLFLDGKITSSEIEVKLDVWPDFVFAEDYDLMSLYELENFIQQNRHLPNVPSEAQVIENGVNVGEMTSILIQKVEELTLHIIDLNKRIEELER